MELPPNEEIKRSKQKIKKNEEKESKSIRQENKHKNNKQVNWKKVSSVILCGGLGFVAAVGVKVIYDFSKEVPLKRYPKISYPAVNFDIFPEFYKHFAILEKLQNECPNKLKNKNDQIVSFLNPNKEQIQQCCDPHCCFDLEVAVDSLLATVKRMAKGEYPKVIHYLIDDEGGDDYFKIAFELSVTFAKQTEQHIKENSYKYHWLKKTLTELQHDLILAEKNFKEISRKIASVIDEKQLFEESLFPKL